MSNSESDTRLDRAIKFYAFEKRHELFAFTRSGFSSWRVMRNLVFQMHQQNAPTIGNVPRLIRLFIAAAAIAKLVFILVLPPKADWIFKGCVSALRWRVGSQWLDPALDPLLDQGYKAFKIIEVNSSFFRDQAKNAAYPNDLEPSAFTLLGRVLGLLLPVDIADFDVRTANLISQELNVDVAPSVLRFRVSTVVWQARLYGLLLRRIMPKNVIVTDTGEYGLRLACLHLGIPFYEVQHGVFDSLHPDAIPEEASGNDQELLIPDILLAKGQFWIDQLAGYRNGRVAVPVGSAIIDYWRKFGKGHERGPEVHIVITTQGVAVPQIIEQLRSIIAAAPKGLNWRMSLKLHPVYDKIENYRKAFLSDGRVTILEGSSDPNIYELLATSDLHLSISSACHFDALALDVPSLMLPLPTHENLLYAVDAGGLVLVTSPVDVWTALQTDGPRPDSKYFCQPEYVINVRNCLDRSRTKTRAVHSANSLHVS